MCVALVAATGKITVYQKLKCDWIPPFCSYEKLFENPAHPSSCRQKFDPKYAPKWIYNKIFHFNWPLAGSTDLSNDCKMKWNKAQSFSAWPQWVNLPDSSTKRDGEFTMRKAFMSVRFLPADNKPFLYQTQTNKEKQKTEKAVLSEPQLG